MALNGVDQRLYTDEVISQKINDFTIMLWVKRLGSNSEGQLIFYNGNVGEDGYGICAGPQGEIQVQVGAETLLTDSRLSDGWQLLTLIRQDDQWTLYQGIDEVTIFGDVEPQTPTVGAAIGGADSSGRSAFWGLVDEVSFYEQALSKTEVMQVATTAR